MTLFILLLHIYIYTNNGDIASSNLVRKSAQWSLRTRASTYKKIDDEKPLIQNFKFNIISRQLNTFTKYDTTV